MHYKSIFAKKCVLKVHKVLVFIIINIFKGEALKSKIFLKSTHKTHNAKHKPPHLSFLEISLINFACRRRGCSVYTPQGVCIYRLWSQTKISRKEQERSTKQIKKLATSKIF
jgi:hypothetical protein